MQDYKKPQNTPLYEAHVSLGAKIVNFNGWNLPVSYEKVIDEHKHVRECSGLFDVSHMGEVLVKGKEAHNFLQRMLINDLDLISPGKGQYTALLNEKGGMIDDLIVYQLELEVFLLCVNAGNVQKDFEWLVTHSKVFKNLTVENVSKKYAQIAIQGPLSFDCLDPFLSLKASKPLLDLNYGEIASVVDEAGHTFYVARTGYTGEKGYEMYIPAEKACSFWQKIMMTAKISRVKPIGLGARDTLRLEACYPLYGQEMDESVSPLEIGLGWATKLKKEPSFLGKKALLKAKECGIKRRLYAFQMIDAGIARSHMKVYQGENLLGVVTSGSVLPSLDKRGGMALLDFSLLDKEKTIEVDVRGQRKKATLVKKPMYQAKTKN